MIYVVRHGQTDWNLEGRYQGRIDVDLNNEGISQAKIISEKLKGIIFDEVFSGPLKRTYKTAKIISSNPIRIDDRLIAKASADLERKLKSDSQHIIDFDNPDKSAVGVESITDFRKRINSFLSEIMYRYKCKNVLIVTHSDVCIFIRCFFEGEPENKDFFKYKLKNCEILKYENS